MVLNMTTSTIERDLPAARHAGERIHTLLWSRRITQAALADKVGVSSSTLGKKLRGEVPITVDELMTVARLLDVEPGDLLPTTGDLLPRLDSNQQPSGYVSALVIDLAAYRASRVQAASTTAVS